ncbi:MAG: hypothetical protein ACJ8FY_19660 [Gemmataceae bacterium]
MTPLPGTYFSSHRALTLLLCTGLMAGFFWAWLSLIGPGNATRLLDRREQGAAHSIFLISIAIQDTLAKHEAGPQVNNTMPEGPVVKAWKDYLNAASKEPAPEILDYTDSRIGHTRVFRSNFGGRIGTLYDIWIAIPNKEVSNTNYVMFVKFSNELDTVRRDRAFSYSPSSPEQLFVGNLQNADDFGDLGEHTLRGYDWKSPFKPDSTYWSEQYMIVDGGLEEGRRIRN